MLGSASMAMSPLSLIVAGPFADAFGVRTWFMMGGVVTLIVALTGFVNRPLLAIEDGRTAEKQPDSDEMETSVLLETAVQTD